MPFLVIARYECGDVHLKLTEDGEEAYALAEHATPPPPPRPSVLLSMVVLEFDDNGFPIGSENLRLGETRVLKHLVAALRGSRSQPTKLGDVRPDSMPSTY
jgi:hypothetical protein